MEVQDAIETATNEESSKSRLNALVAVTVALIASLMALCSVKDANVVQAMQQDQADKIDNWGWYQAHKNRIEVCKSTLTQIALAPQTEAAKAEKAKWEAELAKQEKESKETQDKAEQAQKDYDAWNVHDDQFDAAEGALSLAIALLAVTSLTQKKWLYLIALVPAAFGTLNGLAGLLGWKIHFDLLAKWLGS